MGRGRVQLPSPRLPLRGSVMSSHIGACVGFPLYRRSHFGEFRRPDVAPAESSLARILLEVHGFEHTIPGVLLSNAISAHIYGITCKPMRIPQYTDRVWDIHMLFRKYTNYAPAAALSP